MGSEGVKGESCSIPLRPASKQKNQKKRLSPSASMYAESQDRLPTGDSGLDDEPPAGDQCQRHYLGNSHHVCSMVKEESGARRRAGLWTSTELETANKPRAKRGEAKPDEGGFSCTSWARGLRTTPWGPTGTGRSKNRRSPQVDEPLASPLKPV